MKRMKYKVWDKENNCWYEPTYRAYKGELEDLTLTPSGALIMRTIKDCAIHESRFPDRFEVVLFTGLKDKHGKEIYEGDIVKIYGYQDDITEQGEVFWCTYSLRWKVETYGFTRDNNIEIIGNIHQDKHLLK